MMKPIGEAFLAWAGDSARTKEERFAVLLLCEALVPDPAVRFNWEKLRAMHEARRYDAAYQPKLVPRVLEELALLLPTVKKMEFRADYGGDRPLRDGSVLRFLPALEELVLYRVEVTTLEPLRHCLALRKVQLHCDEVEDYGPLAACGGIEELDIQTRHPWPDIRALSRLPKLRKLTWNSLGHKLESCGVLPAVRDLVVDGHGQHDELVKSVRDFYQLPEMPELRTFWGGSFYRLEGVERYPKLRSLRVIGFFKDVSPVARLPELTHARLGSNNIDGVGALAEAPKLMQVVVKGLRPQDYTVLMEAPALRELYVVGCAVAQPDVEMTRLMLAPREEVFAVERPREVKPLRVIVDHSHRQEDKEVVWPKRPDVSFAGSAQPWDGCYFMCQSEVFWMDDLVSEALEKAGLAKLQGVRRNFGRLDQRGSYHLMHSEPRVGQREALVVLLRTEAINRLREVVDCLRPLLARTRWPWSIAIWTDAEPESDEWDLTERDQSPQARLMEMLEDDAHFQHQNELRNRLLADEHRLKLLEDGGEDAGAFIPSPLPVPKPPETLGNVVAPPKPGAGERGDKDWGNDDDDDEGGIAEADPNEEDDEEHWLPPPPNLNPNVKWAELSMRLVLTEEGLWTGVHRSDDLEYLLDVKAEYPPGYEPE